MFSILINQIIEKCRVIGWYHSHPHITVQPSHVDVRTQGQYQAMDPGFLGLIFSCFSQVCHPHIYLCYVCVVCKYIQTHIPAYLFFFNTYNIRTQPVM
jgi:hypothetical protein